MKNLGSFHNPLCLPSTDKSVESQECIKTPQISESITTTYASSSQGNKVSPQDNNSVKTTVPDRLLKCPQILNHKNFLCKMVASEGRYYAPIQIEDANDCPVLGLVDTGSQGTILSHEHFVQIGKHTPIKSKIKTCNDSLVGVGGNPLPVTGIIWLKIKIGNKELRHPFIIAHLPHHHMIIGMDLLRRLNTVIDCVNQVIWSQVKHPIKYEKIQNPYSRQQCHQVEERPGSLEIHFQNRQLPDVTVIQPDENSHKWKQDDYTFTVPIDQIKDISLQDNTMTITFHQEDRVTKGGDHDQFLTELERVNDDIFVPVKVNGLGRSKYAKLDLKQEFSYVSYGLVKQMTNVEMVRFSTPQRHWISDVPDDSGDNNSVARCLLTIHMGNRTITHVFIVLNNPQTLICLGNDLLHRLAAQIDLINDCLWSRLKGDPEGFQDNKQALKFQQQMPYAVEVQVPQLVIIPKGVNNFPLPIQGKKGQKLKSSATLICLSHKIQQEGMSVTHTPIVDIYLSPGYIYVHNFSNQDIILPKGTCIGLALEKEYYTFGFINQVIGLLPERYLSEEQLVEQSFHSLPEGMFTIESIYPFSAKEGSCHIEETSIVFNHPMKGQEYHDRNEQEQNPYCKTNELAIRLEETYEIGKPERFPGFKETVEEIVALADACASDPDQQMLRELLFEFQEIFARDSYDCGNTDLHIARIQTDPDAPPVFVKQYRLPLAAYESLAEIIRKLEKKGIIRPIHSSYNHPILGILKPNGQWRLCADLRQLNKQVYMSGWPVPYIDQCLAQLQGSKVFTALDCAQGYWTIKISEEDQYKLAFSFGNKQYCWARMPFGFINSGHEFAVLMHKAMPDAMERGTLAYVDDILVKSPDISTHLAELRHVLSQLKAAGIKLSLQKAQWCRTRVNFLGHEVTVEGLNPQKKKVEAVINCKVPTNVKELRSFLGMVNYSRKFIDNYAEVSKPLLQLLKKDVKWYWEKEQDDAVKELKERLTQAPCLAYPEGGKPFYLEIGYTQVSMSSVLFQKQGEVSKVIAYASKTLSPVELKFDNCEKALLSTVWALQNFRSLIQGERIIIETSHQPLQYLQSEHIRKGNISNSRITAWTMSLQGWPLEIRYSQDKKSPVAQGLADLHDCSEKGMSQERSSDDFLEEQLASPYKAHNDEYCKQLPCVYVDGCAYQEKKGETTQLVSGIGIVWTRGISLAPMGYKLGPKSSQIAELVAILKVVEMAIEHGIQEFTIITDSNYVRHSFVDYLPRWKRNNMLKSNNKPVKHGKLFSHIDEIVRSNGLTLYFKKTKGHSKIIGEEKDGNDLADSVAKEGAIKGEFLSIDHLVDNIQIEVITRQQTKSASESKIVQWYEESPSEDLITAQKEDPIIGPFYKYIKDPGQHPINWEEITNQEDLRILMKTESQFTLHQGLLVRTSKCGIQQWVVPLKFRGLMLQNAHDAPTSGHRGERITYEILRDYAYWPHMLRDVKEYCQGCLICAQFKPSTPTHRAPLQKRGIAMPWSNLQMDFIGPVTRSYRGNRYMLTVTCLFTKYVECIPAPNNNSDTCAALLINHIFSRFGLPQQMSSDRGGHFISEVMAKLWKILGVKRRLHIAYRPASSGSVERYNQSIVYILKKFVNETGKDWDVKLPLVLMALRATPNTVTKMSPFELMTGRQMVLPQHLLYRTSDTNLISATTTHQYVEDLRKHLQYAFAFAQRNTEKAASSAKTYYDLKTTKKEYEIGDKVYLYNFNRDQVKERKFLPSWKGPYEIVDKISPVAYKVRIPKNGEVNEKWVHINQLRVCHPRSQLQILEG